MSSSKGSLGHLLGGAGSVEALVCVQSIVHQTVPHTLNLVVCIVVILLSFVTNFLLQLIFRPVPARPISLFFQIFNSNYRHNSILLNF